MKHFLFFLCIPLLCWGSHTLCIDGGASKTILEIVNQESEVVLSKTFPVCTNINVVGKEGVKNAFQVIFHDPQVQQITSPADCQIIAGLAGASLQQNRDVILSILQEWGIRKSQLLLTTDAELALQLHDEKGVILICGTGSICFGKNDGKLFRVGGLGRVLGDEGSGYQIGLQALKAALAEEYGWGPETTLTPLLKELYQVEELKSLIPAVNRQELSASEIASAAALVFREAWRGDPIAKEIAQRAAGDLAQLLLSQIDISHLSDCEVHLWGGAFKSTYADEFLQLILEQVGTNSFSCINYSHHIPATLYLLKTRNKIY